MVKQAAAILLALALARPLAADVTPTADASASTTDAFFQGEPFLGLEEGRALEDNHPVEDFFVVGIISLPFTAFYSFLGTAIAESVKQNRFPPDLNNNALISAGSIALAASGTIALISIDWGGSGKAASK